MKKFNFLLSYISSHKKINSISSDNRISPIINNNIKNNAIS